MARLLQRRRTRLPVAVAVAATLAGTALASFGAPGSGSVRVHVGSFSPATVSASASSGPSVTISWLDRATLGDPSLNDAIRYRLERKTGTGSYAAIVGGPCSDALPAGTSSCTDTPAVSGSYSYRAIATFNSWTATSNEVSAIATGSVATISTAP